MVSWAVCGFKSVWFCSFMLIIFVQLSKGWCFSSSVGLCWWFDNCWLFVFVFSNVVMHFKPYMFSCFYIKDLGALKYFWGLRWLGVPKVISFLVYAFDVLHEQRMLVVSRLTHLWSKIIVLLVWKCCLWMIPISIIVLLVFLFIFLHNIVMWCIPISILQCSSTSSLGRDHLCLHYLKSTQAIWFYYVLLMTWLC